MSINSYVGIDAPCINVETIEELYEAVDLLHTQVMDNLDSNPDLLLILSNALDLIEVLIK